MGCPRCLRPCNRLVAGHPLLLVYIRLDQARIDRECFAPNQPGRNAHGNDSLENPTQGVTLPEAFGPRTTEYRVIYSINLVGTGEQRGRNVNAERLAVLRLMTRSNLV